MVVRVELKEGWEGTCEEGCCGTWGCALHMCNNQINSDVVTQEVQ